MPFLAVALCSGLDGIWSNDKDFSEQQMIKVWKTAELLEIISSEGQNSSIEQVTLLTKSVGAK